MHRDRAAWALTRLPVGIARDWLRAMPWDRSAWPFLVRLSHAFGGHRPFPGSACAPSCWKAAPSPALPPFSLRPLQPSPLPGIYGSLFLHGILLACTHGVIAEEADPRLRVSLSPSRAAPVRQRSLPLPSRLAPRSRQLTAFRRVAAAMQTQSLCVLRGLPPAGQVTAAVPGLQPLESY